MMYGRNNIFNNNSSGNSYNYSSSNNNGYSNQYSNYNNTNKIGSYRLQYRYEQPPSYLTNIISNWRTNPPVSITAREQTLHLTSNQLRVQDYYLIRKKNLKDYHDNQLRIVIRNSSFNEQLLKNECYNLHPYSRQQAYTIDVIKSMANQNNSNSSSDNRMGYSSNRGITYNNSSNSNSNNSANIFNRNSNGSSNGGGNIFNNNNNNNNNSNNSNNIFNRNSNSNSNSSYNNSSYNSNNRNGSNNIFNGNNSGGNNIFNRNSSNNGSNMFNNGNNGNNSNNIFNNNSNNGGSRNIFNNSNNSNNPFNNNNNNSNNSRNIFGNSSNNIFNNNNNGSNLFNNNNGNNSLFNNNNGGNNNIFNNGYNGYNNNNMNNGYNNYQNLPFDPRIFSDMHNYMKNVDQILKKVSPIQQQHVQPTISRQPTSNLFSYYQSDFLQNYERQKLNRKKNRDQLSIIYIAQNDKNDSDYNIKTRQDQMSRMSINKSNIYYQDHLTQSNRPISVQFNNENKSINRLSDRKNNERIYQTQNNNYRQIKSYIIQGDQCLKINEYKINKINLDIQWIDKTKQTDIYLPKIINNFQIELDISQENWKDILIKELKKQFIYIRQDSKINNIEIKSGILKGKLIIRIFNIQSDYQLKYQSIRQGKVYGLQISNKNGSIKWIGELQLLRLDFVQSKLVITQNTIEFENTSYLNQKCIVIFNQLPKYIQKNISQGLSDNKIKQKFIQKLKKFSNNYFKLIDLDLKNHIWKMQVQKFPS